MGCSCQLQTARLEAVCCQGASVVVSAMRVAATAEWRGSPRLETKMAPGSMSKTARAPTRCAMRNLLPHAGAALSAGAVFRYPLWFRDPRKDHISQGLLSFQIGRCWSSLPQFGYNWHDLGRNQSVSAPFRASSTQVGPLRPDVAVKDRPACRAFAPPSFRNTN